MLNRLFPKSQCIKSYSFVNQSRNICGFIHKHHNINYSLPSNTLFNKRHFGKKIQTYNQPDVGEGTVEVDIIEWFIKPGDTIQPLQTIGRGKYEKADVDIFAPAYTGTVHKLIVDAGDVAIVGKPLIQFEVDDDNDNDNDSQTETQETATETETDSETDTTDITLTKQTSSGHIKNILALPATKHFAKEHGIDLSVVRGTGKDGRILKEDVMRHMSGAAVGGEVAAKAPEAVPKPAVKTQEKSSILYPLKHDKVEKIFGIKKAMVKKMTEANAVPIFGYSDEIIMNTLMEIRKDFIRELNIKMSYLPFILKASSLALLSPSSTCLNAHINDVSHPTELIHKGSHNIGIAIDTPNGLIVPNIKFIEQKNILEINNDLNDLINRSKLGQISNDDISGGTFTLSNIGAIGGTYCSPICFVPEVCIGALGTIKQCPKYNKDNAIYNASVMIVSWSADHRVIDGATVARFSNDFKMYLENPSSMLLHLK